MNAAIINIGNEILMGKTINTNLAYLGSELTKLGILAEYAVTIKDEPNAIKQTLQDTWKKYDIVITTGGLGPTEDDLTKAAIANFFGKNQHFDNSIWEHIQKMFAFRNIPIPETNRSQAMVPDDFIPLQKEPYELLIRYEDLARPVIKQVIETINSTAFKNEVAGLGDYDLSMMGKTTQVR